MRVAVENLCTYSDLDLSGWWAGRALAVIWIEGGRVLVFKNIRCGLRVSRPDSERALQLPGQAVGDMKIKVQLQFRRFCVRL